MCVTKENYLPVIMYFHASVSMKINSHNHSIFVLFSKAVSLLILLKERSFEEFSVLFIKTVYNK